VTDQPEHLDLKSEDIVGDNVRQLLDLFPEAGTEGGKVDFDRLRLALGAAVDVGKERYGMNWPGKAECFRTIQLPSLGTLLPCPEESVDFDTSQNMIIEGDNLEVLKLLQKSYLGKVKMIYIDPPYNTGNDFIYPDNYAESLQTYLEYTGQVDAEGKKFSTNTEAAGRFHSKWLNMMYPRLYLARDLLREDGVIFISIDDTELPGLRALGDSVFGEEHLLACVARVSKKTSNKGTHFAPSKDYVVAYAKDSMCLLPLMDEVDSDYMARFKDTDERGSYATVGLYQAALDPRPNQRYWVECPDGSLAIPPGNVFPELLIDAAFVKPQTDADRVWRWSYESYLAKKHLLIYKKTKSSPLLTPDGTGSAWNVYTKYYLDDRLEDGVRPRDYLDDLTNDQGTADLKALGLDDCFPFAKPVRLVARLVAWLNTTDGTYLDFFAGSGTTAQAVLDLNSKDGGDRRFILVQLPEPTAREDYATIADITKERVRRVIRRLDDGDDGKLDLDGRRKQDRGFRVFKLAESNFNPWNADVAHEVAPLEEQLRLHIDHIRPGRTAEDLLFEILLKSGFALTTPAEQLRLAGATVYSVAGGALLVCLERELTLDLIRAIAQRRPERVVCLDEGFAGNDQLKANAVQMFKTQGVTTFRTV